MTLALLMHLIPSAIIIIVLVVSWRWEWIEGILFIMLGAMYKVLYWGRFHWTVYLMISGPLLLTGILFLINWLYKGELQASF